MGYMKEKVAYLKGLAEGMNIGGEGQGKLLNAMISTMDEMADAIDENEAAMAEIDECLDDIYDELDNIDDYLSDDEDEDEDEEDDDEAYEDEDDDEDFSAPSAARPFILTRTCWRAARSSSAPTATPCWYPPLKRTMTGKNKHLQSQ